MYHHKFEVIVLATDMFGYYWGRSFYEEYNKKIYTLGNFQSPYTKYSELFKENRIVENLFDEDVFVDSIIQYANDIKAGDTETDVILIPVNDHFVRYIIQNEAELSKHCLFNLPNEELLDNLMLKENFYKTVSDHGLAIPKTIFHPAQKPFNETFASFPCIVKPSTSIGWKGLDFDEYEKVYHCDNEDELNHILDAIRKTSYDQKLIIQEFIEGDDTNLWDIVTYSNTEGNVQFINMGQVLLQEPSKNMVGNYTAVMSRYNKPFMEKIVNLLNDLGYSGFANFDMKLDPKDNQYKLFEVNLRTGRSSYSVEQMGESLARNIVEDLIYKKENKEVHYMNEPNLFSYVPKYVLKKHVLDPALKEEIKQLIKHKKIKNPLVYSKDRSVKRSGFLALRSAKYILKYQNGTWNRFKISKEK